MHFQELRILLEHITDICVRRLEDSGGAHTGGSREKNHGSRWGNGGGVRAARTLREGAGCFWDTSGSDDSDVFWAILPACGAACHLRCAEKTATAAVGRIKRLTAAVPALELLRKRTEFRWGSGRSACCLRVCFHPPIAAAGGAAYPDSGAEEARFPSWSRRFHAQKEHGGGSQNPGQDHHRKQKQSLVILVVVLLTGKQLAGIVEVVEI